MSTLNYNILIDLIFLEKRFTGHQLIVAASSVDASINIQPET